MSGLCYVRNKQQTGVGHVSGVQYLLREFSSAAGYVEYSFKLPGPQYTLMTQRVPGFSFEQHVINSVRGTVIGSKKPCVRPTSVEQTCRIGFGFCHGARFDVERYVRKNKRN